MSVDQLITTTAWLFSVDRAALLGRSRVARIAEARQALAWALRQSDWSLESIGDLLHRDHTTIIYAVAAIERKATHHPERPALTKTSSTHWQPTKRATGRWCPACSCPDNDGSGRCVVLDPFAGSGTVGKVAERLGRESILIELNPAYIKLQERRTDGVQRVMTEVL